MATVDSTYNLEVFSDLHSEEGNPEDHELLYFDVYYIAATSDYGYRFASNWATRNEDEAKEMLKRLQKHLSNGGKLDPNRWTQRPHAYGSEAYQKEGGEAELMAFEERQRNG